MSRLAVPVPGVTLYATGDVMLSVWVSLESQRLREFRGHDFRVDSGTDITTFPAYEARQLGLYVPQHPANVQHEQTGLEVRSGMLAVRIIGMDQTLYAVPCFFLGDPNCAAATGHAARPSPAKSLSAATPSRRTQLFDREGSGIDRAPHGELIIEKK